MTDNQLHADIAGLRADLQATNKNVERIAAALEKTLDDHEKRLRDTQLELTDKASRADVQELRDFMMKVLGVLAVIAALGLPTTFYLITQVGTK